MRIALDVHTHLVPIFPSGLLGLEGVKWQEQPAGLEVDGQRIGPVELFAPDRLVQWMDERGVGCALVSVPPPVYRQQLNESGANAWSGYLNDGLLSIAERHPNRLKALLHLPLEHPEVACHLLRRYLDSDAAGVAMAAGGDTRIDLSDPRLEPIWRTLNEMNAFVFLHPGSCADHRLSTYYLQNLIGNAMETGVAAAHLVMSGIPNRFPHLRICLAHAGGAFTGLVGRLERGFETRRPGVDQAAERPLQAARRLYVDCIAHHPSVLRLAQDIYGPDHVLYGSDWPFPMGLPEVTTDAGATSKSGARA